MIAPFTCPSYRWRDWGLFYLLPVPFACTIQWVLTAFVPGCSIVLSPEILDCPAPWPNQERARFWQVQGDLSGFFYPRAIPFSCKTEDEEQRMIPSGMIKWGRLRTTKCVYRWSEQEERWTKRPTRWFTLWISHRLLCSLEPVLEFPWVHFPHLSNA